jgi:ribonuclease E
MDDEIDTTPTLEPREPRATFETPRPVDIMRDNPPDEIDTTPRLDRPSDTAASGESPAVQPASHVEDAPRHADQHRSAQPHPSAERSPAEEPKEDPNRPKRSGWWQRKSFF